MWRSLPWLKYLAVGSPIVLVLSMLTYSSVTGSLTKSMLDTITTVVIFSLALSAVLISLRAFSTVAERISWLTIGLGILLFGIGDFIRIFYSYQLHEPPFPSLADWYYLSCYALIWTGLFLQPHFHRPYRFGRAILLLDMMVALFSVLCLLWLLMISPVLQAHTHLTVKAQTLLFAYPTLDILTLLCIAILQFRNRANAFILPSTILAVGVLFLTTADVMFAAEFVSGAVKTNGLLDILRGIAFLLFGAAALVHARQCTHCAEEQTKAVALPSRGRQLMVLLLVTFDSLTILALFLSPGERSFAEKGLLVGTMLIVFLVMVRQWFIHDENRRLYQELRDAYQEMALVAQTDPITKLYNVRYFMERLDEEMERARRYGASIALIFADLDYFKHINDTYGHRVGDAVLQQVGVVLQQHIRATDILARYAGEEFVVLLPETTLAQATVLAERLRHSLETMVIALDNGQRISLTASLGLSAFPAPSDSLEMLLADADSAMYRVKQGGRNNVYAARESGNLPLPFPSL